MVTGPKSGDDTMGSLMDWLHSKFDLRYDSPVLHELWSHLVFGFSVTYGGEIYAAVPEMVLQHMTYRKDNLVSISLGRRPTLEEVQENLASFHRKLNSIFLDARHDPWFFKNEGSQVPWDSIRNKIVDLYKERYGKENCFGKDGWRIDYVKTVCYYQRRLIPPEKRLPPELFAYAEQHFGSMPTRSEEDAKRLIVAPEEMKKQFPQYAAGMDYFCQIIDACYGRAPYEDTYRQGVSEEKRTFIAAHEEAILAVFRDMEAKVEKTVSSLGDVKTLKTLSPEHIKELYDLCVDVAEYIKQQTDQYPHEMTLDQIRALPIELLVRIREEFPWPHFDQDQPLSVGGADDPRLVFACSLAEHAAYMR